MMTKLSLQISFHLYYFVILFALFLLNSFIQFIRVARKDK